MHSIKQNKLIYVSLLGYGENVEILFITILKYMNQKNNDFRILLVIKEQVSKLFLVLFLMFF
mgnify:CR=1 FL=1